MSQLRFRQPRTTRDTIVYDTDIEFTMRAGEQLYSARFVMISFQSADGEWIAAADNMRVSRVAIAETQDSAEAKLIGALHIAIQCWNADTETEEFQAVSGFAEKESQ